MIWSIRKSIENIGNYNINDWVASLKKGCLIYYAEANKLVIYSLSNLKVVSTRKIKCNNSFYYLDDNRLMINQDNKLYSSDFKLQKFEKICDTSEERISFLGDGFCIGRTSSRRPRISRNEIISTWNNQVLYRWDDDKQLIKWNEELHLFHTKFKGDLFALNLENNGLLWKIILDDGISGRRYIEYLDNDELIVQRYFKVDRNNLLRLDLNTGSILWELEHTFPYYNYDESTCKLYGLGGKTFEVINAETGERELQKELKENLHIASHLTYYDNGYLFFSGYRDTNVPVFGAVNVEDGKLVFTQEVEMVGEKSFRKGLDRPVVVGNRLYVRDSMKTLHVFEKEETKEQQYS